MIEPRAIRDILDALSPTVSEPSPKIEQDEKILSEENYLLQAQVDQIKEDLADQKQDREERKKYGVIITSIVIVWLICVVSFILISGFGHIGQHKFQLSDGVLLAILGTFTANIVGLFIVVIRYLFHRPKQIPSH